MNFLFYAGSEQDADLFYFGGFFAPDAFIALQTPKGDKVAVLSQLEYTRGEKEGRFDVVLPLEQCLERCRGELNIKKPGMAEIVLLLAKDYAIDVFTVGECFPYGMAARLQELGVKLEVKRDPLIEDRLFKTAEEAKCIREGNTASAAGIAEAERLLRESEIRGDALFYEGKPLTSEFVRQQIEIACIKRGAVAQHTIVAGGDQACDPHCGGYGPLKAHELIIVDVFPRVTATGYHGDMTRTFLRGQPSDWHIKLVETVLEAQKRALALLTEGVTGKAVHQAVNEYFLESNYETLKNGDRYEGFFHGTGHGLGLAVHEHPRVGPRGEEQLLEGNVVTIEPGLYYPGIGGVRIEDVAWIRKNGYELLSDYHYDWHIA